MGRNTHRATRIRSSAFGREVREPVARSIEKTLSDSDEILDEYVERSGYRVAEFETNEISEEPGYFLLTLTRANGQ